MSYLSLLDESFGCTLFLMLNKIFAVSKKIKIKNNNDMVLTFDCIIMFVWAKVKAKPLNHVVCELQLLERIGPATEKLKTKGVDFSLWFKPENYYTEL